MNRGIVQIRFAHGILGGGLAVVGSQGHLGWASESSSQFGMSVKSFVVDGVCGINLFNIGEYILIGFFYNTNLLKCIG